MTESWDVILGAVMGTAGGGLVPVVWGIIKDSRAGKLVNEETSIGQIRYLKDEAEARALREKERADRAWRLVAWYKANYAEVWRAYSLGPPPGDKDFPFSPPPDLE